MDVRIRNAAVGDIPEMAGLLIDLFSVEKDFTPDRRLQESGLRMLIESGAEVLCAEARGRVVGMMTMQLLISTATGGRSGLIEDVVVAPDWRGRGIASRLLEAMEQRGRAAGCRRMQLVADDDNHRAHDFYRGKGWQSTNLRSWMFFPDGEADR